MTSAIPASFNSSPNSGIPRQRTCHTACVGRFLFSSSIDASFSRNVANPFDAIFGSLMTNPVAVTARGRFPSSAASCWPSLFVVSKLCSRKKPAPTIAYVAIEPGQHITASAEATVTMVAASRAEGGNGKNSRS